MLLAIDTSSKACSCALFDEEKLISECYIANGLTHSKTLLPLIGNCLSSASLDVDVITEIAVSNGPGSYTGLRIGISTVKGLALPKNLPCYGISTLMGLAYNLTTSEGYVCAVLDARVNQIFTAIFKIENHLVKRITPDMAIPIDEFKEKIPEGAIVTGDGAQMLKSRIPEKNLILAPPTLLLQRASSVGLAKINGDCEKYSHSELSPNYLRLSQAEREKQQREENQK